MISNNNRQFTNDVIKNLKKKLPIKHHVTTTCKPYTNGSMECTNMMLCNIWIRKWMSKKNVHYWDKNAHHAMWVFRIQVIHKIYPFFIWIWGGIHITLIMALPREFCIRDIGLDSWKKKVNYFGFIYIYMWTWLYSIKKFQTINDLFIGKMMVLKI
jgi:hypothetical protein